MAKIHKVQQGECISSIAKKYGFCWETLWNHSANSELKAERKDPNVLLPDDNVHIPDADRKEEDGATQERHLFRRKGEPTRISLKLQINDKPCAEQPYILQVDGHLYSGTTDSEGGLSEPIAGNAEKARLLVGPEGKQIEYQLNLGHMDPITEVFGIQRRLYNLGLYRGKIDNILGPATQAALHKFQAKYGLSATGQPDASTCVKLYEVHGS